MTLSPELSILHFLAAGPTDSAAEIRDTRKLLNWGLMSTIESSDGLA